MYYTEMSPHSDNYLQHYGVVGMKWGVRRANKFATKARIARDSAKEWDEMASAAAAKGKTKRAAKYKQYAADDRADANALDAKSKQIQKTHEQRAGGKKSLDYSTKESTGKTIAKSLAMGSYGAMKYNEARTKGTNRVKSLAEGMIYGTANRATAGVVGMVEPRTREEKYRNAAKKTKDYLLND